MEIIANIAPPTTTAKNTRKRRELAPDVVRVPKDFLIAPIFAATIQQAAREVTVGERLYQIGGWDPLRTYYKPPALDVRHARVLFTALSFRNPFDSTGMIPFSMYQFCQRYADSNSGVYSRKIRQLFADLADTYIRITDNRTREVLQYHFFDEVFHYNRDPRRRDARLATSPQQELWFDGCRLSSGFLQVLDRVKELQSIKWKTLNSLSSPLAQAIYLYIPSRAHHHSADDPFEITLTKLLNQVCFKVPRYKCLRRQLFTLHEDEGRSILQQLDKKETLHGRFRVEIRDNGDGSDCKLVAWEEKDVSKPVGITRESKLEEAYRQSGRPLEWLEDAWKILPKLTEHEVYVLVKAGVDVEKDHRFLQKAKALLQERKFMELLSEAKGDALEGRRARVHPTARLIDRVLRVIRKKVPPASFTTKSERFRIPQMQF